MLNIKKLLQKEKKPTFSYDQAVIINIDLGGFEDFGTKDQQEKIRQLEKEIQNVLPDQSGLDGDEFGDGEVVVYLYGPSADKIFKTVESVLKKEDLGHITITLQYGSPDDPKTKEKKFTL